MPQSSWRARDGGRHPPAVAALAFLLGDLILQMQAHLPPPSWALVLPVAGLVAWRRPSWMPLLWAAAGFG